MFPLRRNYVRRLMFEVGFQSVKTYGDFQETYRQDDPDFFIHVASKKYISERDYHPESDDEIISEALHE